MTPGLQRGVNGETGAPPSFENAAPPLTGFATLDARGGFRSAAGSAAALNLESVFDKYRRTTGPRADAPGAGAAIRLSHRF